MRRVLFVLILAAAPTYYLGLRGRLAIMQNGAQRDTVFGRDFDAPPVAPGQVSSVDPRSDLGVPAEARTPAVVGRALEDNARRALETLTQRYDTQRSEPPREGDATRPVGPGLAILRTPNVLPGPPAVACAAPVDTAKNIIALHEELAEMKTQKQSDAVLIDQARSKAGDLETELLVRREQGAALAARLAEAERNAASVEGYRANLQSLSSDLATVRAHLAQAARAAVGRRQELQQAETARGNAETDMLTERKRADALAARVVDAESKLAAQVEWQEAGGDAAKAQVVDLARPDDSDRAMVAALSAALPSDVPAHVVLHYARGSEHARLRAEGLELALKGQGLEVTDPVDIQAAAAPDSVTFFYKGDERSAERIAGILAVAGPIQGRLAATGSVPRPGTIEVTIAN